MDTRGPVTETTARRLYADLAREQATGRVPSLAAALVRDGEVVWRESRGVATAAHGGPHEGDLRPTDLQYRIGSITKTMTAVLVLQLRDEGLLRLEDPVAAHLPELRLDRVTLRSLLAHDAGLPAEPEGPWWERSEGRDVPALLAACSERPFPVGATHHYSNLGYGLLGEVAARATGGSWWEALAARVLEPLDMLRTSFDPFAPHAQGWSVHPWSGELVAEPATDTGAMAPAGQVWSTVTDLARWAHFLLTGDDRVLPRATLREMATPQAGTAADGAGATYGLGLRLVPGGSGTLVGHTGSMPGFQACLLVDRERRAGAVVLANSTRGLAGEALVVRLLDTLEDCEPVVVPAWRPTTRVPSVVAEVLGVWYWGNTPQVLRWDGERLHLGAPDGRGRGSTFVVRGTSLVGDSGYHHGEVLHPVHREEGVVHHLEVSTFVLTRTPYDPSAPIPGGAPRR